MDKEVRICEICGTVNEANDSECESCGEDLFFTQISFISSVEEKKSSNKKTMILKQKLIQNIEDGKSIEIPLQGCLLGRDGDIEVDYFQQFSFISNEHASFRYNNEMLVIKDEGSTNGTKINGVKIHPKEEKDVNEGDIIKFANIEFIIK